MDVNGVSALSVAYRIFTTGERNDPGMKTLPNKELARDLSDHVTKI